MTPTRKLLTALALASAAAMPSAFAQTSFSTNFDNVPIAGSFASVALNGATVQGTVGTDRYLEITNNTGPAAFSFSLASSTQFLLVNFVYLMTNAQPTLTVAVRNSLGQTISPQQTILAVDNGNTNPNLSPLVGNSFSWHFGVEGQPLSAGLYTLEFARGENGGAVRIDDISISAVPEPATAALMAMAGLGLAGAAARRRRSAASAASTPAVA